MAFDPKTLPPGAYAAYRQGPKFWPLMVEKAVQAKITDIDFLTSVVFYMHHPERNCRPIAPGELTMIAQWKSFRVSVMLKVSNRSTGHNMSWDIPNAFISNYSG